LLIMEFIWGIVCRAGAALRARWVERLGDTGLARLLDSLAALASSDSLRTGVLGWLGA